MASEKQTPMTITHEHIFKFQTMAKALVSVLAEAAVAEEYGDGSVSASAVSDP